MSLPCNVGIELQAADDAGINVGLIIDQYLLYVGLCSSTIESDLLH